MPAPADRPPTLWRRLARLAVPLVGADLGVRLAARTTRQIGPAQATLRIVPGCPDGGTVVNLPPFGSARLATHAGPLRLDATLVGVTLDDLKQAMAAPRDIPLERELKAGLVDVGVRAAAGSVVGGALSSLISRRSVGGTAAGAAIGAGMFTASAAAAALTAKLDAWRSPQYSGLLTFAPQLIGDVQDVPKRLGGYRKQIEEIVASVSGVYRRLTALPGPPPDGAIAVVFVADIHNNPLAFDVIKALVEQYDAALVIDAGDMGDWGTPQEAKVFADVGKLPVPYVFIKGNHDSTKTVSLMKKHQNVVVLQDGEPVEVAGLRLVGDADPRFTPDKATGDDDFGKDRLAEIGKQLAAKVRDVHADIAVVHDPVVARQLAGVAPTVLSGHTHRRRSAAVDGSLLLTQGSSGGAGLRGVRTDPPQPLEVSVLLLDPKTKKVAVVDEVTVAGLGGAEVSLVRRTAADLGAGA